MIPNKNTTRANITGNSISYSLFPIAQKPMNHAYHDAAARPYNFIITRASCCENISRRADYIRAVKAFLHPQILYAHERVSRAVAVIVIASASAAATTLIITAWERWSYGARLENKWAPAPLEL